MDRPEIGAALLQHHEAFIARVLELPMSQRAGSRNGKWTPAQHMEHILRAVRPVAMALLIPKWFLRWRIGVPNRPPRDYEGLVQRYKEKLAAGGRASGRFVPPAVPARDVESIASSVNRSVALLARRVNNWSEQDLDSVLLPHPLLGKITVREMLFFTIYHVQHHHALVDRDTA
ncbi:MAG: DinB family protein [Flavobacteriales bacterium]|nr:DinB family protein [Flavobacteriales bacterium]